MFEKLVNIICEQLNQEAENIKPETRFQEDLEADSLDLFELVNAIEDEFEVEFDSDELDKVKTVADVADYLKKQGVE